MFAVASAAMVVHCLWVLGAAQCAPAQSVLISLILPALGLYTTGWFDGTASTQSQLGWLTLPVVVYSASSTTTAHWLAPLSVLMANRLH